MFKRFDFPILFEPFEVLFELTVDKVVIYAAHACSVKFHGLFLRASSFLFLEKFVELDTLIVVEIALEKQLKGS